MKRGFTYRVYVISMDPTYRKEELTVPHLDLNGHTPLGRAAADEYNSLGPPKMVKGGPAVTTIVNGNG